MAVRVLPVRPSVPLQQFQVELDGVLFEVLLRWNERAPAWVMTLRDSAGTTLAAGVRVCLGAELLPTPRPAGFPPGQLLVVSMDDTGVEPGLEDFSATARTRLVYLDAAEVAEASA